MDILGRLLDLDSSGNPAAADSFPDHARRLTLRLVRLGWITLALLCLFVLPFDFLLYDARAPELLPVLQWQGLIGLTAAAVLLLTRADTPGARHPFAVGLAAYGLAGLFSGWVTARAGGLDSSIFYNVHWAPLVICSFVVGLRHRIAATAVCLGLFAAAFAATAPGQTHHPALPSTALWLLLTSAAAVLLGHVIFLLVRVRFHQGRELQQRAAALEELDRLKNQFVANVSHELRTPLTNILASLRELGRQPPPADTAHSLDVAQRNARRLLLLVNDLLLLTTLGEPRRRTARRRVDFGALVEAAASTFGGRAAGLRLHVAAGAPTVVRGDPAALWTAISNLVDNAFKFGPEDAGPVEVSVDRQGEDVRLQVQDHGIGIAPTEVDRIFGRFYQVDGGATRWRGGTGIGLAVVRETVEHHGGRVTVSSRPGAGSLFEVRLPADETPAGDPPWHPGEEGALPEELLRRESPDGSVPPPESPEPVGPLEAPLILVCDDELDVREGLRRLLGTTYRVVTAPDGAQALETIRTRPPRLVLADVMMPRLSGTDLLAALRADPNLADIPVILLTARSDARTKVGGLSSGANDYVTKPYDEAELLARIQTQLSLADLTRDLRGQVARYTAELRALAASLVALQERERARLAGDLHDDLGQCLTALRLAVEAGPPGPAAERIAALFRGVHEALDRLLNALRPRLLERHGLDVALGRMVEDASTRFGLPIRLDLDADVDAIGDERAVAIFRVVQEALTNVGRHARAQHASVRLAEGPDGITLEVRDDGVGFDPEAAFHTGRLGLLGIRERARALDGQCRLESTPGRGTRLVVTLPPETAAASTQ